DTLPYSFPDRTITRFDRISVVPSFSMSDQRYPLEECSGNSITTASSLLALICELLSTCVRRNASAHGSANLYSFNTSILLSFGATPFRWFAVFRSIKLHSNKALH